MPAKVDPKDWDRLFRQGAPRRAGPFRLFLNMFITCIALALLVFGAVYGLRFGTDRLEQNVQATQVAIETQNAQALATRTSRALETVTAAAVAAAATPTAAPEVVLGTGSVIAGGNLRNQPNLAPETVIGLICPGDQVVFLEQRDVDASLWYRIRIVQTGASCDVQHVTVGSSGWASSTLLTPPTP